MHKYDGVAKLWFESEEDLMEAMGWREKQKFWVALLEDENNFIDHYKSSVFIVKKHEL